MSKKKYISDIITEKEIDKWEKGEIVSIKAPTGAGKSYFIMNTLYQKAVKEHKKILMLLHRKNCIKQFKKELGWKLDSGVIDIMSYQALESRIRRGDILSLSKYDYLCLDEWHRSLYDSGFSLYTDLSLNIILKQENSIRIFISATSESMIEYLKEEGLSISEYEIEGDFSHITDITFFQDGDFYFKFIYDRVKEGNKGIIFINDTEKAFELHLSYPHDTLFVCSEGNSKYRYVDTEKLNSLLENERFEESVLITTIALDTGVNIYDRNIKHIAVELSEKDVIIQCLGRKRIIDKEDTFSLYMKEYSNHVLNGFKRKEVLKLEKSNFLLNKGECDFVEKYGRELEGLNSSLTYDELDNGTPVKRVHKLMRKASESRINELNNYMKNGFINFFTKEVFLMDNYISIQKEEEGKRLEKYLKSILGVRINGIIKEELINEIGYVINGRTQRGRDKLNHAIKELDLNYYISIVKDRNKYLEDGSLNPHKDKTYWVLIED